MNAWATCPCAAALTASTVRTLIIMKRISVHDTLATPRSKLVAGACMAAPPQAVPR
jgi:hypothetical protein